MQNLAKLKKTILSSLKNSQNLISHNYKEMIFVPRPIDVVANFMTNPKNFRFWLPGWRASRRISGNSMRVGTTFEQTFLIDNQKIVLEARVQSFQPMKFFSMTFATSDILIKRSWMFESVPSGTKLYYLEESKRTATIKPIFSSIYKSKLNKEIKSVLAFLKKNLSKTKIAA